MNSVFEASWRRCWQGLHALGEGLAVRDALLGRYSEPARRYHTLQHLEECLSLFERVQASADHPHEVEMALWFHDAIYELRATDNEARSADWAESELRQAGVDLSICQRVRQLVLATRHTATPQGRDEQVLVDIDLSILGAPDARFEEYERQIREEYAYVPGFVFRMKRKAILRSFLDRPLIYSTPLLHRELEARARVNLLRVTVAGPG